MRYSLVRVSDTMIDVLDNKHGGIVGAKVFLKTEVSGTGWKLAPRTSTRGMSRKLHATPEAAIASMKYMTLGEARAALYPVVATKPIGVDMVSDYDAEIRNAKVETDIDHEYSVIIGRIYNDAAGRFRDGTVVHTSKIVAHLGNSVYQTLNTRYLVTWRAPEVVFSPNPKEIAKQW